jgi:hypothetical protein
MAPSYRWFAKTSRKTSNPSSEKSTLAHEDEIQSLAVAASSSHQQEDEEKKKKKRSAKGEYG